MTIRTWKSAILMFQLPGQYCLQLESDDVDRTLKNTQKKNIDIITIITSEHWVMKEK